MQAVNLLPGICAPGRRWTSAGSELSSRRILPIGGIAAVGLALIFGLFYFHERSVVSEQEERARDGAGTARRPVGTGRADQAGAGGEPGAARRSCTP